MSSVIFLERSKKMVHGVVLILLCLWHLVGVFGVDELKSVSVMEGDSVTLNSSLTEIDDEDLILWRFGAENTLIVKISVLEDRITVYDDVLDGRFRDRLKLDHQTGSLTITNTRTEHTGAYQLQTSSVRKSFNLTVYVQGKPLIVLISAAAAGSLLIVTAVFGIFCICRKHRKTDKEDKETTYADPKFYKRRVQKSEDEVVYAGVITRR